MITCGPNEMSRCRHRIPAGATGRPALQAGQNDPFRIRVAVDLVNVNFSAMDSKGRMIPGLKTRLHGRGNGELQKISLFAREQELPLTLALLIDVSPSVAPVFDQEKLTASAFLESIVGRRDLALVIAFADSQHWYKISRKTFPSDQSRAKPENFQQRNVALRRRVSRSRRKAFPRGRQKGHRPDLRWRRHHEHYNKSKAMIAVQRSNAVIYAISNGGDSGTMRRMSEETGGAFFRVREARRFREGLPANRARIENPVQISYQSTNTTRDGAFRRIRILPRDSDIKFVRDEDTMRPRIRAAASSILALLVLVTSGPLPAQEIQLRSRVELVLVPVAAKAKMEDLLPILPEGLHLIEAGKKQTITNFSVDPVPISAVILIDTGITQASLNRIKSSFPALMGAFAEEDEIALYRFDKYVEKMMDFSNDRQLIERTFNNLAMYHPDSRPRCRRSVLQYRACHQRRACNPRSSIRRPHHRATNQGTP